MQGRVNMPTFLHGHCRHGTRSCHCLDCVVSRNRRFSTGIQHTYRCVLESFLLSKDGRLVLVGNALHIICGGIQLTSIKHGERIPLSPIFYFSSLMGVEFDISRIDDWSSLSESLVERFTLLLFGVIGPQR